ncbi:metabotropic glutamate receptor 2-like [Schistocerca nitens]|uniref:metabotropic glutamate receptor 2-like n=1 Tax=Schistocerca nitens TaxID=7011 RepID=UPI002118B5D7|nr:metabotropic glutamate receptor 2-like [Schistocerca nitens]
MSVAAVLRPPLQQRYLQEADGAKAHLSAWKGTWPVKREAVVEGELVLGGLMMVHERSDTVTCGPVMPQGGVQALETMLYTLDRINAPPSLLPNVTIGAHILDDCDMDTYGLEMAVDFIKVQASLTLVGTLPPLYPGFVPGRRFRG